MSKAWWGASLRSEAHQMKLSKLTLDLSLRELGSTPVAGHDELRLNDFRARRPVLTRRAQTSTDMAWLRPGFR